MSYTPSKVRATLLNSSKPGMWVELDVKSLEVFFDTCPMVQSGRVLDAHARCSAALLAADAASHSFAYAVSLLTAYTAAYVIGNSARIFWDTQRVPFYDALRLCSMKEEKHVGMTEKCFNRRMV